jgi:hypothetical protein
LAFGLPAQMPPPLAQWTANPTKSVCASARAAVPAGAAVGLLAWLIPLGVAQTRYGLGPTAAALAAIMGFTGRPLVPLILTLVLGALLGLTGAWLGVAARALLTPPGSYLTEKSK